MKRQILFILLIIIVGGFYLHAMQLNKSVSPTNINSNDNAISWISKLIDSNNISEPAVNMAINGYYELKSKGLIQNDSIITIIDFSKPSNEKRFFILDIKNELIVKSAFVAHGIQSGLLLAESFSNKRLSNKSSLGLYITKETYQGKHGYSLRIDGMSKGLNDNARKRAIVIHGADYVSESFIQKNGRLGRSFGCPALALNETEDIINLIKNGSCLYIYHPSLIPISQTALGKLP